MIVAPRRRLVAILLLTSQAVAAAADRSMEVFFNMSLRAELEKTSVAKLKCGSEIKSTQIQVQVSAAYALHSHHVITVSSEGVHCPVST